MSGFSRRLLWAATCLSVVCVLSEQSNSSVTPSGTESPTLAATTAVPTTPASPVTTLAPGERRPNGLPAFVCPAEPHCLPGTRGARARRAALRGRRRGLGQHGGPPRSGRGRARCGRTGRERPERRGREGLCGRWAALTPKRCTQSWLLKVPCNPQPYRRLGRRDVASLRGGNCGLNDNGAKRRASEVGWETELPCLWS